MTPMQIFLLIDMFILGVAVAYAVQHGYTHFLHKRHPERDHAALKDSPLPEKLKETLIKEAHDELKAAVAISADALRHDLKATTERINLHFEELANDAVHQETERYQKQLEKLHSEADKQVTSMRQGVAELISDHQAKLAALSEHSVATLEASNQNLEEHKQALKDKLDHLYQQAEESIGAIDAEIKEHAGALKAQIEKEVAAEKQVLLAQFEHKLSDAVTAFLVETLQHDVDLGAQAEYLNKTLEEHKAELLNGVGNETKATS